jgi:26S proteasome regulatory subunit N12
VRERVRLGRRHRPRRPSPVALALALALALARLPPFLAHSPADEPLPPSAHRLHLIGLRLMSLLVENRLAELHSELESLATDAEAASPFVAFPLALDAALLEGAYNRIQGARPAAPSEFFLPLLDAMQHTVRCVCASEQERREGSGEGGE